MNIMKSSAAASLSAAACPATRVPRPAVTGWAALCVALAGMVATSVAQAGVEFVTPANACNKVDTISDGKDLRLNPGRIRFDVWGSGIDVNPAVSGGFGAMIVGKRNGATNAAGPCKLAIGSVTVEVNSAVTATTDERRTLQFRMPLGDLSPLRVTVFAFRSFDYRWSGPESSVTCLGTLRQDLNNDRLTISLPAGAQTDTSNCVQAALRSNTFLSENVIADLSPPCRYQISGLPAWLRLDAGTDQCTGRSTSVSPRFIVDTIAVRRIAAQQTMQITATAPNGRANAMTLVVNPGPAR
jgi:hypothetical protein